MPTLPNPNWKHVLEVGMGAVEPRRAQVRRFVDDLVKRGEIARDQAGSTVDEIVALGQSRAEEFRSMVRTEVNRQIRSLGLVTQDDLHALERRLARRNAAAVKKSAKAPAKAASKSKPAPAKTRATAAKKAAAS